MATRHGKDTQLFIASVDASSYFRSGSVSEGINTADVTTFTAEDHSFIVGQGQASATFDGPFDTSYAATLNDFAKSTGEVIGMFPAGDTLANRGRFGKIIQTGLDLSAPVGDVVIAQYTATITGGWDVGVSLHSTAAAETSAGNEATYDATAAAISTNGGAAYLWCTAFTGTDLTVTVEHSTNDSTWATLATFTQLTAVGSQQVVVAEGTTVNRYLRAEWSTSGGFTTATFAVAFARR